MLESGRREQTPPRRPKNLPRCFQDTPKTLPRPPKMTQDGPKTPPRDPKNPPRCPKLASGRFQNPPRRFQDASKTQFKRSKACPRHSRPLPEAPKVDFWRFWERFGEVFLFQALTTFKKCDTKFNSKFKSKVPISLCQSVVIQAAPKSFHSNLDPKLESHCVNRLSSTLLRSLKILHSTILGGLGKVCHETHQNWSSKFYSIFWC